jgi:EAL domain-containing protein (putative c-di-GMP-specific phosphodiesterase class I)
MIGALERSDLSPERIIFEVTESEEINDDWHLQNILGFYHGNGFRIALGNLGAGYASLNLLADLARTSSSWMPA